MFRKSINRRLMILFFIVGVSSLSIIGVYSYFNAKDALLKRTLDQLTSIRVIKKEQVEIFFNERINTVKVMAENDYLKSLAINLCKSKRILNNDAGNIASYYKSIVQRINFPLLGNNQIYLIVEPQRDFLQIFTFQNDSIKHIQPDTTTYIQLKSLWDETAYSGNPVIVDFKKHTDKNKELACFVGKGIAYKGCNAVLALRIPLSDINKIMLEDKNPQNGLGKSGEVYLVGNDFFMRSNSRFIPNSVLNVSVTTQSVKNAFKDKYGSSLIDDYRTIACLSSYDRLSVPGLNWAIVAEIDYDEAMIPIVSIRNDIVFLSLIICIFLFSLSHFISRTITSPIVRLKNAVQQIGEGALDVNLKSTSHDEIGLLTDAFNTMTQQLKDERLKRMSALYDGQELERQRISRELHDGLGQKLVAIKLQMESTSKLKPDEVSNRIKDIKESFIKTIDEVRQISNNLAPNILNESGIDIALQSLCNSVAKTTDIDIEFSVYGDYNTSDSKIKFYIYRIAQEGINNAIKHSGASKIQLQLIGNKDNIILVLEDNGKGFEYGGNYCTPCNGIYNMKERARLLNGTLDIESEHMGGTTIRLKVPKKQI
ncbi:MAG TPA: histidine kinase [Tenuifilaceae bacterium]|nr:histidine kinase [Tenuifilaceae bacterium]